MSKTADRQIGQGKIVVEVARLLEPTLPTYHRWRQRYVGIQAEEARRLTLLVKDRGRLKELLVLAEL